MIKCNFFRFIITIIIACTTLAVSAQKFTFDHPTGKQGLTLVNESKGKVTLNFSIHEFELQALNHKGEAMSEISFSSIVIPNDKGMPNVPRISRFIAVPQGAEAVINVKRSDAETIQNVNIAPALEVQIENAEPNMEYEKNEKVYNTNSLYPASPIEVSEKMSLRGVDAVVLGISPFQYNPVTKELVVYRNMEVEIEFVGGKGHFGDDRYRSRWFDPILANALINYESLPKIDYEKRSQDLKNRDAEGCEFLIVIPNDEAFRTLAEQLQQYRIRQGISTQVMSLNEMGCTTTAQMKTFFHNAYNTWEVPPVAVLLMGDHGTNMNNRIPAETIPHSYSGNCITDNQYADVTGDKLPEMCFARMAAENETQMNVLVSKVLEYEYEAPCMDAGYYQNPITALGWQTERWFQICSEVVGGYLNTHGKTPVRINAIYEGTPGSTWSSAQNTSSVVNYFGPNGMDYIPATPGALGGWTGGTAQHIINAVNSGAFILQHRDHGYEPGWGEPDFTIPNISSLTNVGKLTYVFSINCLTGKFDNSTPVFAEVFHRHTHNGQNAGAVGVLCPTETSYSFVNDAFVWGVYDLFDPAFMPDYGPYAENSGNWMPGFGNVAGKYFLAQSSWPYNSDAKIITYQMFTQHSDPFLRLYTEVPQELTVSHSPTIFAGATSFTVSCEEGALIALTIGNEILAVAEATGTPQNITIPPQVPPTEILITCTKQNYLRHESTVSVVPAEGPYVIGFEWNVIDENGNAILEYTETGVINMTAKNVGVETANNVTMTISTDDPYITINKTSENFGNIAPEATILKNNAFSITVAQDVPNNHTVSLKMESTDGTDMWESFMSFKVYSPIAEYEGNGVFGDIIPGSTLDVMASFKNSGGAPIYNAVGTISTTNEHVTINNATFNYGNIDATGSVEGIYNITISDDAPTNESYDFHVVLAGDYEVSAEGDFAIQNVCNVVFDLHDSYGDGWNGCKLRVTFDDGTPQVEYTISNGNSATFTKEINVGTNVTLTWVTGNYGYECSFTVSYEDGDEIFSASNPNSGVLHTFECNCNGGGNECNPIEEITATVDVTTVTLNWTETENATSYIVKRNGVNIESATETTFVDSDVLPGNYNYCVSAVYNNGCTSFPVCTEVIISLCASLENLTATVVDSLNIELTWDAVEESEGYNIYYEGILIESTTETNYFVSDLDWETEYCYEVSSVCESGESMKVSACATTPYEPCYIPVEVIATVEEEMTIKLTWNTTTTARSYDVYRDGELIGNVNRPLFTDNNLEIGTYCYTVRAKCKVDESEQSEQSCGNIVSIVENEQNFKIYPNPANHYLTIEGENIESVMMYNMIGQVVKNQKVVSGKNHNISTESLVNGVYVIRIITTTGQVSAQQVTIVH